jgi:hypothetical protein
MVLGVWGSDKCTPGYSEVVAKQIMNLEDICFYNLVKKKEAIIRDSLIAS